MISNFSKIYRRFIVNEINVASDDVVGLVEKIYIEGIGDVDAKIDSGNGAYNVIDGEVISKRGDNIIVKTKRYDSQDATDDNPLSTTLSMIRIERITYS